MKDQLYLHLNQLTGIRPYRNYWNLDALEHAASYIEKEFKTYGLAVNRQKWTARGNPYSNVIGKYLPEKKERLIVGAHYDVFGNQSGADDNTSGVAGLLVLAAQISKSKPNLPYGIDFVAYCLEEPPFFGTTDMGSYQHAHLLFKTRTPVVGMICLDMIGYFSDAPNSQEYPVPELAKQFPSVGNFIAIIGHSKHKRFAQSVVNVMKASNNPIKIQSLNFSSEKGLAGLSDHRNYWFFGYPAVMINDTASYRNPNYHQKSDVVKTLDLEKMNAVVEAVLYRLTTPFNSAAIVSNHGKLPQPSSKKSVSFMERIKRLLQKKTN